MPKIRVLPIELRNKVRAGEVVERPASVLKELIENSIDAGSRLIAIEVTDGGKRLIQVSDNGQGMGRDDALLCLQRHATSKLEALEGLSNIQTLGFRGEALPSIASVSRMRLTTAPKGASSEGVCLLVEGGETIETKAAPALGTEVLVRDLFFNTPARKKFLKRSSTELLHIIDCATRLALSHPHIGFTLKSDGETTMDFPKAASHRERLHQVYGQEFMEGLLETQKSTGGMDLLAFVSGRTNFRASRGHQHLYVNQRPVKDPAISHAVYSAYEGVLPQGRHPMFFLFLTINPKRVDFNVHPMKKEVRFEDRESVYRLIKGTAKQASGGPETAAAPYGPQGPGASVPGASVKEPQALMRPAGAPRPPEITTVEDWTASQPSGGLAGPGPLLPDINTDAPFVYLGDTFLALSGRGGLTLVDHHAAHERVLYERLLEGLNLQSRQLLFPRQVKLSPTEYRIVLDSLEMLFEFGLQVEDFGHETVLVRSLPEALEQADLRGILADVSEEIKAVGKPGLSLKESVAARIACHGSVRGKKILNNESLAALLKDLEATEYPEQCPHGRPTRLFFNMDDLKKMFKRK